ncbi:cupin domain-containing protein [Deinococcus navajonensis]|uniref:Cupin domain-containing protein n=1 Tax=Deinococcus navajonensis TaxID=309884 RepID=A0ABV8XPQ6_9DEIO
MLKRLQEPGVLLQGTRVRVLLKTLPPHGSIPSHTHPNHNVLVTALTGEVSLHAPDEQLTLHAGEVTWIDETTPLALTAGAEGATFSVTLARQGQGAQDAPPSGQLT